MRTAMMEFGRNPPRPVGPTPISMRPWRRRSRGAVSSEDDTAGSRALWYGRVRHHIFASGRPSGTGMRF